MELTVLKDGVSERVSLMTVTLVVVEAVYPVTDPGGLEFAVHPKEVLDICDVSVVLNRKPEQIGKGVKEIRSGTG